MNCVNYIGQNQRNKYPADDLAALSFLKLSGGRGAELVGPLGFEPRTKRL